MNQRERFTDLFLLPVLLLLGGIVALRLESDLSERLVYPDSPYMNAAASLPIPAEAPPEPIAERVALVIVEGFQLDTVAEAQMTELRELTRLGARATLAAAPPADALPTLVTALTGATRELHGVSADFVQPSPDLLGEADNTLVHLARQQRPARHFGPADEPLITRMANRVDAPAEEIAEAFADTPPAGSGLDIVRLQVDPIESSEYISRPAAKRLRRIAAEGISEGLATIRTSLDPQRDTMAVLFLESTVSGPEVERRSRRPYPELFLAGAGIEAGAGTAGRIEDLGTTLSVLLGTPFSFANQGEPLMALLADGPRDGAAAPGSASILDDRLADLDAQKSRFRTYCSEAFHLGTSALAAGAERAVVQTRAAQYRSVVLPQVLMGLVIALILLFLEPRITRFWTVATGAATGGLLFLAYAGVRKIGVDLPSLTAEAGIGQIARETLGLGIFLVVTLTSAAAVLVRRRLGSEAAAPAVLAQRTLLSLFGAFVVLWGLTTMAWFRFDLPAAAPPSSIAGP